MFDDILSINFMLVILLFVFATVLVFNIVAALLSGVLSIIIRLKKL